MYLEHGQMAWKTENYYNVRELIFSCNGTEAMFLQDVDVGSNLNFTSVTTKVENIESYIKTLNELTTKLETSFTKLEATNNTLESTNSQILEFLRKHHTTPASGLSLVQYPNLCSG